MMPNNKHSNGALARIGSFFRGNSSSTQAFKQIGWKQSGEQETWAEKAVDVLVKKLKKQGSHTIKDLENALKNPNQPSKCVTIPRSMDGRLQVSNCKALPHVIYCRVWRFPDLQSHHELRPIPTCEYSFGAKKNNVCINPYHYERIKDVALLPPILVPLQNEFAPGFSRLPTNDLQMQQQQNDELLQHRVQMPGNIIVPQNGFSGGSCSSGQNSPVSSVSSSSYGTNYLQQPNEVDAFMDGLVDQQPKQVLGETAHGGQADYVQVHYEQQPFWASISYYELNSRVGEAFKCSANQYSVTIDGFTYPCNGNTDRFCLGQLSNVNRNSTIEQTRQHIGKGARLFFKDSDLFIECLSEKAIFVQSRMSNYLHQFEASTVMKLNHGFSVRLFNNYEFGKLLDQAVKMGYESAFEMAKMCTIRISFVKGWGAQYQRQDITSTPCWIEIHLHEPLQWLDSVLNQMGSPLHAISSVS